jgi:hypothetical protein
MKIDEIIDYRALAEPANKWTMIIMRRDMLAFISHSSKKDSSLHFLEQNTATFHFSFVLPRLNDFTKVFMTKVDQLISGGLPEKMTSELIYMRDKLYKQNDNETARPLTMDHLGVCFAVIISCLGFSCIVFIIEHLSKRFVNLM